MNNRIILSAIFVIIANLLAAGSASAQTWTTEAVEINKSESFVSEHCSDPVFTINGRDIREDINKTINDGSKDSLNPSPCASSINPKSEIQNLSQTTIGDPPLELDKAAFIQKTQKLQIPFIANNGQVDEQVRFYAKTFGGTVFVTKDGEIVYALPKSGDGEDGETHRKAAKCAKERNEKHISHKDTKNTEEMIEGGPWRVQVCNLNPGVYLDNSALFNQWRSQLYKTWGSNCKFEPAMSNTTPIPNDKNETHPQPLLLEGKTGIALREEFVGARVNVIQGEEKSVTKVNYFKGNDPEKWKTDVSTYDFVNLGEIYKGIELRLKAYGDNVEKLFCVKPGASPETILVQLNGAKSLKVNEDGQLVAETELGPVKFTKPVAYQEIDGKRVEVDVEYSIQNPDVGWVKRSAPNKNGLNGSNQLSGIDGFASLNPSYADLSPTLIGDPNSPTPRLLNSLYGFKVASYDHTQPLIVDPLLASTYLGGSSYDYCNSLALDTEGNVYVAGETQSANFPTTSGTGAYDTSFNSGWDVFVSKLTSGLGTLTASTFLGGSGNDRGYSLALDTSGNVYVTGWIDAAFPTTSGAYDTSWNGGSSDVFVSKLDGNLSDSRPTVATNAATNVTTYSATLNGAVNANGISTTAWFDYGATSGSYTGSSTTQSVSGTSSTSVSIGISGLSASTTYYYRIAASNSAGTSNGGETSFATTAETTAPAGSLSINSGSSYTTSTSVTLNLSATDAVGVTGYYISTSSTTPLAGDSGWTSVSSTTSYSANPSYTLSGGDGSKTIYVWYKDAAGNVSSPANASITLDTTAPTVSLDAVTSPTNVASQWIGGAVELGATVSVATNTGPQTVQHR